MKVIIPGVVAGITTAALVSLAPVANADAGQTVMIRPGGFVSTLADTRSAGHVAFLQDGLHVWTDDTSSNAKAAEYVAVPTQGLPSSAALTWYGTTPQPGAQIVFDMDSDRTNANTFNILVGEPVYGDDYWYTGGQARAAQRGFTCPETTGGSGSDCHGTLAEWQAAIPTAEVYAAGFSLGSGIKGDGVIHDIQVGDTDYRFTSEPAATKVPVSGHVTTQQILKEHVTLLDLTFSTDALGANEVEGKKLTFKVTDNDDVVFRDKMGADEESFTRLRFPQGTGRHTVLIYQGGEVDQKLVIKTGK